MALACNLGRTDRALRMVLGMALGITGILISGHPHLGRILGITGAVIILGAGWGT
ncbi:MAG: hypothetical protein GZ088_08600 [Acidipila sp.]|nr:hypothetical protein [Acidipila sp.]